MSATLFLIVAFFVSLGVGIFGAFVAGLIGGPALFGRCASMR